MAGGCLWRSPGEIHHGQRQQYCLRSRILLPLAKSRRNRSRSKAANKLKNQEFAATGVDAKNSPKTEGSKFLKKSNISCF